MPSIIGGSIAIVLGIWGISVWWWSVAEVFRGLVPILLVVCGLVALAAGISMVREDSQTDDQIEKNLEEEE